MIGQPFIYRRTNRNQQTLVGNDKVLCALFGGVDSTVVATLLNKALGEQLLCVFVNNGLLRKNEFSDVLRLYKKSYIYL